jgi:hypothetical protein
MASSLGIAITHCLQFWLKQCLFGIKRIIVDIFLPRFLNLNIYLNNLQNGKISEWNHLIFYK